MKKQETAAEAKLRKEADAARKRKERQTAKEAKLAAALKEEMDVAETVEQFWSISVTTVEPEKLAAWKARQERVFDLMWYIDQHVKGTYDASRESDALLPEDKHEFVSVEEGDRDLKADIALHGQCLVHSVLRIGSFWKKPDRMLRFASKEDATSVFARFGILTAVPDHTVDDWNDYVRNYRISNLPKTDTQVSVDCSVCSKASTVDASTLDAYHRSNIAFRCQSCSNKLTDSVLDDWGRVHE
jgi:hypothetical protein